ncbi:AEC family transporter [Pseudomonas oryzihabitans]|uniref:AEC family transporter n=1 Tax=Pseudomonas oryzihabitans TaxID=47885 RepID=UPI002855E338|nr:AEC family transporter [Pseudomonas psychrotolerans]MDR6678135.1 putative permease [Pseudomonas psychrotolerans]
MSDVLTLVQATFNVTAPVFALVLLGCLLKRLGWIDTAFVNTASSLVFRATMPTLLFLGIIKADLGEALQPLLLGYFALATVTSFLLVWCWAIWRCPHADRGVYVQGAFRGNCGIVGLALAATQYGDYGLSVGGILAGMVILFYNVLSTIVLALYSPHLQANWRTILRSILGNPLIIGILVAIPFAYWQWQLPRWLESSARYFAGLTLPLALMCIGATLSLAALRESSRLALGASLWKIVWIPLLGVLGALALGIQGPALGILFLYLGCPTAASSFVMARAAGGNAQLAAAIVVISTLGGMFTTNLGLLVLKGLSLL